MKINNKKLKTFLFMDIKKIKALSLFLVVCSLFIIHNVLFAASLNDVEESSREILNHKLKEEEKFKILRSTDSIIASISSNHNIVLPSLEKISNEQIKFIINGIEKYSYFVNDFSKIVDQKDDVSLFNDVLNGYRFWTKSVRFYTNINNFATNIEMLYTLNNTLQEYFKNHASSQKNNVVNDLDKILNSSKELMKELSILITKANVNNYARSSSLINNYKSRYNEILFQYNAVADELISIFEKIMLEK